MGWITLAEAQAGAGTTESSNAAAKLIATWLENKGAGFSVSHSTPTEVVYTRDGISFVQEMVYDVKEYRALEEELAVFLSTYLNEDNTCKWMMYGLSGNDELHEVEATYGGPGPYSPVYTDVYFWKGGVGGYSDATQVYLRGRYGQSYQYHPPSDGVIVKADSQRSNASGCWMVRVASTTYVAPNYGERGAVSPARTVNKAFTPFPPDEAYGGVVVSERSDKVFIAKDTNNNSIYQKITLVEKEYRYLTKSQASAMVTSESNSRTYDLKIQASWSTSSAPTYRTETVRGGGTNGFTAVTDKVAISRPQGRGLYMVAVTETTYQASTS